MKMAYHLQNNTKRFIIVCTSGGGDMNSEHGQEENCEHRKYKRIFYV